MASKKPMVAITAALLAGGALFGIVGATARPWSETSDVEALAEALPSEFQFTFDEFYEEFKKKNGEPPVSGSLEEAEFYVAFYNLLLDSPFISDKTKSGQVSRLVFWNEKLQERKVQASEAEDSFVLVAEDDGDDIWDFKETRAVGQGAGGGADQVVAVDTVCVTVPGWGDNCSAPTTSVTQIGTTSTTAGSDEVTTPSTTVLRTTTTTTAEPEQSSTTATTAQATTTTTEQPTTTTTAAPTVITYNHAEVVRGLYVGMLDRESQGKPVYDQAGFDYWVGRMDGNESVLDVVDSFQYHATHNELRGTRPSLSTVFKRVKGYDVSSSTLAELESMTYSAALLKIVDHL